MDEFSFKHHVFLFPVLGWSQVSKAHKLLSLIDTNVVASIQCKRAARAVLKHQADMILGMQKEGLLNQSDASEFLDTISDDITRVDLETKKQLR